MTFPVSERIDQVVLSTIAGITTGNHFQVTLSASLFAPTDAEVSHSDMDAVVDVMPDEPAQDNDTPNDQTPIGHTQWYRPVHIRVYLLKSPDDSVLWSSWRNLVRAEVEKAMMANRYQNDGSANGGVNLALDTYCRGYDDFVDANDARGVIIYFRIHYRTAENDPYTILG